jgi:hypothetical protein
MNCDECGSPIRRVCIEDAVLHDFYHVLCYLKAKIATWNDIRWIHKYHGEQRKQVARQDQHGHV